MSECFLFENPCPNRSAVCRIAEPDGDDCPLYRWFKAKVLETEKDIVAVVRCKDCKWFRDSNGIDGFCYCDRIYRRCGTHWYCADGERKDTE